MPWDVWPAICWFSRSRASDWVMVCSVEGIGRTGGLWADEPWLIGCSVTFWAKWVCVRGCHEERVDVVETTSMIF